MKQNDGSVQVSRRSLFWYGSHYVLVDVGKWAFRFKASLVPLKKG